MKILFCISAYVSVGIIFSVICRTVDAIKGQVEDAIDYAGLSLVWPIAIPVLVLILAFKLLESVIEEMSKDLKKCVEKIRPNKNLPETHSTITLATHYYDHLAQIKARNEHLEDVLESIKADEDYRFD